MPRFLPRRAAAAPALGRAARTLDSTWAAQVDVIARRIGLTFLAAGATGLLSLAFPPASYGSRPLAAVAAMLALVAGVVVMRVGVTWRWHGSGSLVLAFATAVVSLGVYAGGAPLSGALFFYV